MWYTQNIQDVVSSLKSNVGTGLNDTQVTLLQKQYGKNKLNDAKKESLFVRFIKQFNDFMVIILIISAIISAVTSYLEGSHDYIDSFIIVAIVVFNAIMGLIQETKAEKSIEALKAMFAPNTKVKRNGKIISIPSQDVVPGDILKLESGDLVPADCRIISSYNLLIDESALTGETIPVIKDGNKILPKDVSLGDTVNMAFASTTIVGGRGEAVVTDIGMQTKVGKIANIIIDTQDSMTPLQKKLDSVGKYLGIGAIIICIIIFIIGTLKKIPLLEMFTTSVGLAVASIPEGLPAIVTILLSIGVTKMSRKNAIIRKLPAVETLGSSTVICSDKTGTLTQNKMKVTSIPINENKTIKYACMCTDCNISNKNISGNPSEVAIVEYAINSGLNRSLLYNEYPRISEIPFDSKRKLMTTIHKCGNKYLIITKGAPDVLISKCTNYIDNNSESILSSSKKSELLGINDKMASGALRVLGVAIRYTTSLSQINDKNIENNLTFVGLIGMMDPPRDGVVEAIRTCKTAGVKIVMITGDHITTAKAIASKLGILTPGNLAITGKELDEMPGGTLQKNILKYSVFARVSPEHKVKIVNAFKRSGAIVAMTGDGVNDAPALKNADIGIAMGKSGTDVAKNSADMILTDDNFVTITEAVKEGRHIYDNIRKAVHFLISTNIGELLTIFIALILGFDSPLLAIHLLWINLVTDSFPAIALGMEKAENDIMNVPPINPKKGIFANGLWEKIFTEGLLIGILVLVVYYIGLKNYNIDVARTMAFASLGLIELVHSINVKRNRSILKSGIKINIYLVGAIILGAILQIGVISIPSIASMFNSVVLTIDQWKLVFIFSLLPLPIVEISKLFKDFLVSKQKS